MATFIELQDRVNFIVDDDSLVDKIAEFLNQGVSELAGGVPSLLNGIADPVPNILTPPLPELFVIGTVTTDIVDPFVDMPADFQRDLQFVAASTGSEIDIAESFIDFTETYPLLNRQGRIAEVIEHGKKLYYQGIPLAAEEVIVHYYRKPVDMIKDDDVPDGIPEHLHFSILVSFASWKAFELLEDGIEGEIPNTGKYKNAYLEAVRVFELTLPSYNRGINLRSDN